MSKKDIAYVPVAGFKDRTIQVPRGDLSDDEWQKVVDSAASVQEDHSDDPKVNVKIGTPRIWRRANDDVVEYPLTTGQTIKIYKKGLSPEVAKKIGVQLGDVKVISRNGKPAATQPQKRDQAVTPDLYDDPAIQNSDQPQTMRPSGPLRYMPGAVAGAAVAGLDKVTDLPQGYNADGTAATTTTAVPAGTQPQIGPPAQFDSEGSMQRKLESMGFKYNPGRNRTVDGAAPGEFDDDTVKALVQSGGRDAGGTIPQADLEKIREQLAPGSAAKTQRAPARNPDQLTQPPVPKVVDVPVPPGYQAGGFGVDPISGVDTTGKYEQGLNDAVKAEGDARLRAADVASKYASQIADRKSQMALELENSASIQKDIAERRRIALEDVQKGYESTIQKLNDPSMYVDRKHFWNSKSAGDKALAGIAMLLGGVGAGTFARLGVQSQNDAVKIIQQAIQDDMDAQRENISTRKFGVQSELENKRHVYNEMRQAGLDEAEAYHAEIAAKIDASQRDIEALASRATSDNAKNEAQAAIAKLEQDKEQHLMQIAAHRDSMTQQREIENKKLQLEGQKLRIAEEAARAKAAKGGKGEVDPQPIIDTIHDLRDRFHQGRFGIHDTPQYENMRANAAYTIAAYLNKAGHGRLTQNEIDAITNQLLPPATTVLGANADAAFANAEKTAMRLAGANFGVKDQSSSGGMSEINYDEGE